MAELRAATLKECRRRDPTARALPDYEDRPPDAFEHEARELAAEIRRVWRLSFEFVKRHAEDERLHVSRDLRAAGKTEDGAEIMDQLPPIPTLEERRPACAAIREWVLAEAHAPYRAPAADRLRGTSAREQLALVAGALSLVSGEPPDPASLAVTSLISGAWPNLRGKPTEYTPAKVIDVEAKAMRAALRRVMARETRNKKT